MEAVTGLMANDCNAADFTVTPTVVLIEPFEAATRAVPVSLASSRPVVLTVATAGSFVAQVTEVVKSCVLPSWKTPIAESCSLVPAAKDRFAGLTEMDTRGAAITVKVAEA